MANNIVSENQEMMGTPGIDMRQQSVPVVARASESSEQSPSQGMRVIRLRKRQSSDAGQRSASRDRVALGFGLFSIGLGLAEIVAPKGLAKLIGVKPRPTLFRVLGLREVANGIGLLTAGREKPGGLMWARVGGDAVDLALLGAALTARGSKASRVATATAAIAGVTALDVIYARQLSSGETTKSGAIRVKQNVTTERTPEELYRFWRDFENLPRFMDHLESVQSTGGARSHWVAKAPAGASVAWDAEILDDRPNESIRWRSLEGADVDNNGSVRFTPATGGRGTVVDVEIEYNPPAGALGAGIAKLFGEEPNQQVHDDLRRFKQLMETGEIPTTEGQPSGREEGNR